MTADQALNRLIATPTWNPQVAKNSKTMYEELHLVEGVHGPTVEFFDQSLDFLLDPTHNPAAHQPPPPGAPVSMEIAPPAKQAPAVAPAVATSVATSAATPMASTTPFLATMPPSPQ